MGYSCSDFVDSVLDALGIELPDEAMDDPAWQARLTVARICLMADVLSKCRTLLSDEGRVKSGATLWLKQAQETIDRIDALLSPMALD
jgi:hypothetical protein